MSALENPQSTTHIATHLWRVGRYSFLEARPKVSPGKAPIYFAYVGDELARRESFDTIEDAMLFVSTRRWA